MASGSNENSKNGYITKLAKAKTNTKKREHNKELQRAREANYENCHRTKLQKMKPCKIAATKPNIKFKHVS